MPNGLLVISDTYTAGWRAAVDGTSAPIYPTNLALRGIPVPKGTHTVVLTYTAPWLRSGLVISLFSHVLLLAVVIWWQHDRRSRARWPLSIRAVPGPAGMDNMVIDADR